VVVLLVVSSFLPPLQLSCCYLITSAAVTFTLRAEDLRSPALDSFIIIFDKKNRFILGRLFPFISSFFFFLFSGIECGYDDGEEVDSSSMTKRIEEDWILDMDMGGVFFCCYVCLPGLSVGWGFVLLSLSILV